MTPTKILALSIFLALATAARTIAADQLSQLTLSSTKTDVLDGRLTLSTPSQAKSQALQHGIMAAPEPDHEQTRLIIDAGQDRMVLMVYELFAKTGTDFQAAVKKTTAAFPHKVNLENLTLPSQVSAVEYFPVLPTKNEQANLVMGLYVAHPDGTVQEFMWYINPSAATHFNSALNLAKSMAQTIAPGSRPLDTHAAVHELPGYSATKSLFVSVPDGYVVTLQHGADFLVHHIHKITALPDGSAELGIYLGNFPSRHREGSVPQGTAVLLGKTVPWYHGIVKADGHSTIAVDALISLGAYTVGTTSKQQNLGVPAYADVFLAASGDATIDELKSIAATLRIADRSAQE